MLLLRLQLPLPTFSGKQFNCQYNQAKQKDKNADTVNAVHITDPFIVWPVWIFFPQVEVFSYLFPDSHMYKVIIEL